MDAMKNKNLLEILVVLLLIIVNSCGNNGNPAKDVIEENEIVSEETTELPSVTVECKACHNFDSLSQIVSQEQKGIKEWMSVQASGLIRIDPIFPSPSLSTNMSFPWQKRGRHNSNDLNGCSICHPVRSDGIGHGVRTYPSDTMNTVFAKEKSCDKSCHSWLTEAVAAQGFENADGQVPSYNGSLRPTDLLQGSDNAHSDIWKKGASIENSNFKIVAFNSGCGGCHNVFAESHGTIANCLDCHVFGGSKGELHANHVSYIADQADNLDVKHPEITFCAYCHREDEVSTERSNAACYNCHLSGHQPLDKDGKAHFWRTGE